MKDPLRQTGRTTRMLEAAIAKAREGGRVLIVAANLAECDAMREAVRCALGDETRSGLWEFTVHGGGVITFVPGGSSDVILVGCAHGAPPDSHIFIDHRLFEVTLSKALAEMHRWDAPDAPTEESEP